MLIRQARSAGQVLTPSVLGLRRRLIAIMRIISLVPAGTEIVFALGLERDVVAVSHECDYPPQAHELPRLTRSAIGGATLTSAAIDAADSRSFGRRSHHTMAPRIAAATAPENSVEMRQSLIGGG
jgi:hypothetical protein